MIVGVIVTETLVTADAVHVPTPDTTVYVVEVVGVTVMVPVDAGAVPLLAVHTNGPEPLAVKTELCPEQIDVEFGDTVIGAGDEIVTVPVLTKTVGVFDGSNPFTVTVYTVVAPGETVMVCVVCPPGLQENVGFVKFVLAEIVAVCPEHTVALVTGAISPQLVEPVPPDWLKLMFCA